MRYFVAPIGVPLSAPRAGRTPSNPLAVEELFTSSFLTEGQRFQFLPGVYDLSVLGELDTSAISDLVLYGDGKVFFDAKGQDHTGLKIGSSTTVCGIRFKDHKIPLRVEDGADDVLVINCWDYHYDYPVASGTSFQVGEATNVLLRNLTSRRDGRGIQAFTGTSIKNCVAVGLESGQDPWFVGKPITGFETDEGWGGGTSQASFSFHLESGTAIWGDTQMNMALRCSNPSGAVVRAIYNLGSEGVQDLSLADGAHLVFRRRHASGVQVSPSAYRVYLTCATGENVYHFADTEVVDGWNVLVLDLASPDSVSGVVDLSAITSMSIGVDLANGGVVQLALDHFYLLDSSVEADYNVHDFDDDAEVFAAWRGASGWTTDDYDLPLQSPSRERMQFDSTADEFPQFMTGGENGSHVGGLFNGSHVFFAGGPGHLAFTDHVIFGSWRNDERFYDTVLDIPGPEAEGLAIDLDETDWIYTAQNIETQNLSTSSADGDVRDEDDGVGQVFDKVAGSLSEMALAITPSTPPVDLVALGAQGVGIDYKIPVGDLEKVLVTGLRFILQSTSGSYQVRRLKTDLVEGWNRILLQLPSVVFGSFDPSDIQSVIVGLAVDSGEDLEGHVVDHLHAVSSLGYSSAPASINGDGQLEIDLTTYPEGEVARAVCEPFLCRGVRELLRALVAAVEDEAEGAVVDGNPTVQSLLSRTLEVRLAEARFTRSTVTLTGASATNWTPITRLKSVDVTGDRQWVQLRLTLRNRVVGPLSWATVA